MRAAIVIVGLFATLFASALALFTVGLVPAIVAALLLLGAIGLGFAVPRSALRGLLTLMVVVLLGSVAFAGWGAFSIARALSDTSGEVDPPDQVSLAAVEAKISAAEIDQGFRIEFTMDELNAAVQEALATGDAHPVRAIEFFVKQPDLAPDRGILGFEATFKSGGINATGELQVDFEAGRPVLGVRDLDLGVFSLPGVAEGAASDLVDAIADFNDIVEDLDGELQDLRIYADRVVALGIQRNQDVTVDRVLDRFQSLVGAVDDRSIRPEQRYEPGSDQLAIDGSRYYVALGDSLAANVGVGRPGRGYVSKFHKAVGERDELEYGLRNFGVSGETSASILGGQLDTAVEFMRSHDVAYVTIDIGANDFLGHLSSTDCAASIESADCGERLDVTYVSYRKNIAQILDLIQEAAPNATIVFLTAYNPFSFGFPGEVAFERQSNDVTERFNSIAAEAAQSRGMLVADGEGALVARALIATHMADGDPDIHPNTDGYDMLTHAIVKALQAAAL